MAVWAARCGRRGTSGPTRRKGPENKKAARGRLFDRKQKITSSRGLREQLQVRRPEQRREPKRRQRGPEPERVQRRGPVRVREPVPALSYRKQPGRRLRRWLPERETCSFFTSLMNEKNIFHFAEGHGHDDLQPSPDRTTRAHPI